MCSVIDAGVVIGNYTAFEALEPGNNIGVNDVLRRPTVSYCFKVKPENGSTVVIVCLFQCDHCSIKVSNNLPKETYVAKNKLYRLNLSIPCH